jgi:uncharacterized protein (UPF0332 family)
MSFDWIDYLTLADRLRSDPQSPGPVEACLRSAVSRSYYAVFKTVLNFAVSKTAYQETEYGSDHVLLPRHLQESDDSDLRKIGIDLDRLRLNRKHADYDDELKQDVSSLAEQSVLTAQGIMDDLNPPTETV